MLRGLLLLALLLGAALPRPLPQRLMIPLLLPYLKVQQGSWPSCVLALVGLPSPLSLAGDEWCSAAPRLFFLSSSYSVPEDFTAPLELPQRHFGLVDDYGIKPKQPRLRARQRSAGLRHAGKAKRDERELLDYYGDGQP
ncbi:protein Frey 1 [Colius striatus]|uniref:protein Frey 1 n=1 Tax=Colius striatus TaxID=57412 RepID=UPI002B1D4877|nr:protein Frey 1 [Colius striatus]